ncbi:glycosyltransferase family 2 protein [Kiritimatiellota bacterium B12222]|nr:glycosyltransferase family 2 protein [Kiritimatiellota bacterium B12222]
MKTLSPSLETLPPPPAGKTGWPWTEAGPSSENSARVSIVMPCYNAVTYIEESIRSVLLQGLPNVEFIVIDGGSSDGSVDIIEKYAPWITYWISEPDKGQSDAINKGLAKCTGDYFNWHNGDDVLLPGSLIETLTAFEQYPDALYISRRRLYVHPDGRVDPKSDLPPSCLYDLRTALLSGCPGPQPGSLMRMDQVKAAGGVDINFVCCMDEELMMKLRLQGPGYILQNPGILFRIHPEQQSTLLIKERIAEKNLIIESSFNALPADHPLKYLHPSARICAAQHAMRLCQKQQKKMNAFKWYLKSQWLIWREQKAGRPIEWVD